MTWDNWQKRLAGEEVETFEMEPNWGFYRKPLKEGRKTVGWTPVAFFPDELVPDRTVCLLGDTLVTDPHAMSEIWLHCVKWPLSEENYRQAADHGVWFDADPTVARVITGVSVYDDGRPAEVRIEIDPVDALTKQISEAKKGVSAYAKIEDDETAAKAQDLRSHLTGLAGKLEKEREALVRPHLDAQRDINAKFKPIIDDAKEASATVKKSIEAWEMTKRSAEAKSNVPSPRSQIRGSTGRAASVQEAFDAVITDISAYFQTVKERPEVVELLQKLAQRDINAGLRPAGVEAKPTVRVR